MEDRIELVDYISVERLQDIQESFSNLCQVSSAISDKNGSAITIATGVCDFCKFIRVSRLGSERCRNCDAEGAERAFQAGKPVSYTCHAGLTDFVAPIVIDGQRVGCFVGGQIRTGDIDEEKVRQVAKDIGINPEMCVMLAKRAPLVSETTLQNAMNFIHNVTLSISDMAYKQYQIEKAKNDIEYAAQLKEDFMANMSHEIRTPMNGVIGLAELALETEIPDETKGYLKEIRRSGKSLLTLMDDILDFSEIESGSLALNEEEYNIKDILDEIEGAVADDVSSKNLSYITNISSNVPDVLIGDEIRIAQVILNIVKNAVKFTEVGQVLVDVSCEKTGKDTVDLKVSIEDTGVGIAEENMDKLFQSFRQLDSKRNRQADGVGLGLAICKHLVEIMGGEIGVESRLGEGSRFFFHVPQKIGDVIENEDYDFIAPDAKVLVVDDNNVNLTVAAGVLSTMKIQADKALSGAIALEMTAKTKYDLIFMDYMMPDMDGIETTRTIREKMPEYKDVPIIALTANVAEDAKNMLLGAGLDDYATKPVIAKKIQAILRKWLPKKLIVRVETVKEEETGDYIKIEGLDTKTAIENLGSESFFLDVLKNYYGLIDKKVDIIRGFYAEENWPDYTIQVHALKSSSRQIGAMELGEMAALLEEAGNAKNVDYIKANTESTLTYYLALKPLLEPIVCSESNEAKQLAEDYELRDMLNEIAVALDDLDMDGMNTTMEKINSYSYAEEKQTLVDKLSEAVNMLDVDTALEVVEELEDLLG